MPGALLLLDPYVDVLILAIVAVLITVAFYIIVRYLVAAPLSYIPVIGGYIANNINSAANSALSTVTGWAESAIDPAVHSLYVLASLPVQMWNAATQATSDIIGTIEHQVTVALPGIFSRVSQDAAQAANLAQRYAEQHADSAVSSATQFLETIITNQTQTAIGYAESVANYAQQQAGALQGQLADAERALAGAIDSVGRTAEQEITDAREHADQLIGGLAGNVEALARDIPAWVERRVGDAVHHVEGELTEANAQTAATAAAATAAVALAVEEYMRKCGDNLCSSMGPLSGLLANGALWLELGELLAFFALASRDPEAAVRVVEDGVIHPVRAGADAVLSAAGVI